MVIGIRGRYSKKNLNGWHIEKITYMDLELI
jgi:hypothetical protein